MSEGGPNAMAKTEAPKSKKTGRPPKPMPEPIPDTPENILGALLKLPRQRSEKTGSI